MKIPTAIEYINIDPDFHHPATPLLFKNHDGLTSLDDCPFQLKTDSYEVIAFGESIADDIEGERTKEYDRVALIRYTKKCGHTVEERITFCEGVEDFDHYGTKFIGADYSISNFAKRIEFFRTNLPCDVCQMADRAVWLREIGEGARAKNKAVENLKSLLDYNYGNWQKFINWDETVEKLKNTKYNTK